MTTAIIGVEAACAALPKGAHSAVPCAHWIASMSGRPWVVLGVPDGGREPTRGTRRGCARAALKTALDDRDAAMTGIGPFLAAVYAVLPQYIGATGDLTKFGKAAPKPRRALTTEQRAAANAKAAATRAARHTMGKNQKKASKGTGPATPALAAPAVTPTKQRPAGRGDAAAGSPRPPRSRAPLGEVQSGEMTMDQA